MSLFSPQTREKKQRQGPTSTWIPVTMWPSRWKKGQAGSGARLLLDSGLRGSQVCGFHRSLEYWNLCASSIRFCSPLWNNPPWSANQSIWSKYGPWKRDRAYVAERKRTETESKWAVQASWTEKASGTGQRALARRSTHVPCGQAGRCSRKTMERFTPLLLTLTFLIHKMGRVTPSSKGTMRIKWDDCSPKVLAQCPTHHGHVPPTPRPTTCWVKKVWSPHHEWCFRRLLSTSCDVSSSLDIRKAPYSLQRHPN